MSPSAPPPRDGRVRTPSKAALGRTTGAHWAGTVVLEPPPSGTELGRLRGGGWTSPEGAGAAGSTTEAAGGAYQSVGTEPLKGWRRRPLRAELGVGPVGWEGRARLVCEG